MTNPLLALTAFVYTNARCVTDWLRFYKAQAPTSGRPVTHSLGGEVFASRHNALEVEGRHASAPDMAPGKQSSRLRRMVQRLHGTSGSGKHSHAAEVDSADEHKHHSRLTRRRWRRQTKSAGLACTTPAACPLPALAWP